MIGRPVNDRGCLALLDARARKLARTPAARAIGRAAESLRNVVALIRAKPQHREAIPKGAPTIACDVSQPVRFWAPDPDCVERTLDFMVMVEVIEPRMLVRAVTIDLPPLGRHTMPLVGAGHPVNLSPLTRRGIDWGEIGKIGAGVAVGVVDTWLSAYGLKPVGDAVTNVARDYGINSPFDKDSAPGGALKGGTENGPNETQGGGGDAAARVAAARPGAGGDADHHRAGEAPKLPARGDEPQVHEARAGKRRHRPVGARRRRGG